MSVSNLKVTLKTENGQNFIHTPNGEKYRVLHKNVNVVNQYLEEKIKFNFNKQPEKEYLGSVVALQNCSTNDLLFSYTTLSDEPRYRFELKAAHTTTEKQFYTIEEVADFDVFDKKLAITIPAGKALSGKRIVSYPFDELEYCPLFYDALWDVYSLVQRKWLAPSKYYRDKDGIEHLKVYTKDCQCFNECVCTT